MTFIEAVRELELRDPLTRESVGACELIKILKEDVVLAVERPGSWEGSNMLQVLCCHGLTEESY